MRLDTNGTWLNLCSPRNISQAQSTGKAQQVALNQLAVCQTCFNFAELHMYSQGGHGFGMRDTDLPVGDWVPRFTEWMKVEGLME